MTTVEQADNMTVLIIVILLGVAAGVMYPLFVLWVKTVIAFIKRRKKMYNSYLQRLEDFEQYYKFMEKVEFDYQVKWLIDIQEQARRELQEFYMINSAYCTTNKVLFLRIAQGYVKIIVNVSQSIVISVKMC